MCRFCIQVPEQQQDQRAGARSSGPPGRHSTGPETEPKPHQPDPRESLPAPEAHPAVSTTGSRQFNGTVSCTADSRSLSEQLNQQKTVHVLHLSYQLYLLETSEEGVVVSVDRLLCVLNIQNAISVSYTSRGG